jgi:hypothetical protein
LHLDEIDLCYLKALLSILSALDYNTVEINNVQIGHHPKFRLISTLNGKADGSTSKQQNIFSCKILSRFITSFFAKMTKNECDDIFAKHIPSSISNHMETTKYISKLHVSVVKHFSSQYASSHNLSRENSAATLRNFNTALGLIENVNIFSSDVCSISYLFQLPKKN